MRNLKLINYSTLQNLIKHFGYCNAEHKNPNKDSQNLEFFSEIVHSRIYLQKCYIQWSCYDKFLIKEDSVSFVQL